jgi:hypothetical protein
MRERGGGREKGLLTARRRSGVGVKRLRRPKVMVGMVEAEYRVGSKVQGEVEQGERMERERKWTPERRCRMGRVK